MTPAQAPVPLGLLRTFSHPPLTPAAQQPPPTSSPTPTQTTPPGSPPHGMQVRPGLTLSPLACFVEHENTQQVWHGRCWANRLLNLTQAGPGAKHRPPPVQASSAAHAPSIHRACLTLLLSHTLCRPHLLLPHHCPHPESRHAHPARPPAHTGARLPSCDLRGEEGGGAVRLGLALGIHL